MLDLDEFRVAVEQVAARDDVHRAVLNLYAALTDAIELRRPVCIQSGRCCRFDEFGHRLFVTTMEMGTFIKDLNGYHPLNADNGGGCPFQAVKLCGVHQIRPFGCRIFFCDETSTQWQQDQYARFHAEFKRLHEALNVPYFYLEWREALKSLGVVNADAL